MLDLGEAEARLAALERELAGLRGQQNTHSHTSGEGAPVKKVQAGPDPRLFYSGDIGVDTDTTLLYYVSGSTIYTVVNTGTGAPTGADYLVGTTQAILTNEIVVGATPGGELGGTWASPTVDSTHSGSAHHTQSHDHSVAGDNTALVPEDRKSVV